MGLLQRLLVILGVTVVAVAIAVGIIMFNDNAISANRDALTNDLVYLGGRAQEYYHHHTSRGGGGNSFSGLTMSKLTQSTNGTQWVNPNGVYQIDGAPTATEARFRGMAYDKSIRTFVEVYCVVTRDSVIATVIN